MGMRMLGTNTSRMATNFCINCHLPLLLQGRNDICLERCGKFFSNRNLLMDKLHTVFRSNLTVSATNKSRKKLGKRGEISQRTLKMKNIPDQSIPDKFHIVNGDTSKDEPDTSTDGLEGKGSDPLHTRNAVLQACTITSGLILLLAVIMRQASHIAFTGGWLKIDSSSEISFSLETWHLELVVALVALVSTCRCTMLKIWPDFAESSEAANQQILSALQPLDYVLVAFLPGISEELLFRGALLPILGLNWGSALAVGALFGGLHLGGGRNYSFAIWATFVGFLYGMAAIASSSIIVPMAAHSLSNLVGGILWRYAFKPKDESFPSDQ